jgi:hypothetical protein
MKKVIVIALVFLATLLVAEEKYRIERLSGQQLGNGIQVVAYHDTESGIEILCFYDRTDGNANGGLRLNTVMPESISCVPTGRRWTK